MSESYNLRTYVRFSTYRTSRNGQIIEEDPLEKKVQSREPRKVFSEISENCYAFSFFDRIELETEDDVLIGQPKNKSGIFYIGREMTLKEAEQIDPKTPEQTGFVKRMKKDYHQDNKRIVLTRFGTLFSLRAEDTVLSLEEIKSE